MIKIPEGLEGKELIKFLVDNKIELIKQKCAFTKNSQPTNWPYSVSKKPTGKKALTKAPSDNTSEEKEVSVIAIANAANFIDTQMDMLLPDCWKKTIKESGPDGKNRIWHLKNHCQNTDGVVGKINSLYSEDYSLLDLGIDMAGTTQCLVMESMVKEALDGKCYEMYADKMINQHSIGLQYVKLELAINDVNYPKEFDVWNKYFMHVINKYIATKAGYFWVVSEIKLMEISAVLWGSNELTPTVTASADEDDDEEYGKSVKPPKGTGNKDEPVIDTTPSISEMIAKAKIKINI
jgi:hypothetical protein